MTNSPDRPDWPGPPDSHRITQWLDDWRRGDDAARDQLFVVIDPYLRQMAGRILRNERRDHTLEPNALVGELCVRLLGTAIDYRDRAHFFAIAAQTMRRILIDHARGRLAGKRGGERRRVTLSAAEGLRPFEHDEDVLALDEALQGLARADPRAARVVELRFFGGLTEDEIAQALDVSTITVKRDWKAARAWLIARLRH